MTRYAVLARKFGVVSPQWLVVGGCASLSAYTAGPGDGQGGCAVFSWHTVLDDDDAVLDADLAVSLGFAMLYASRLNTARVHRRSLPLPLSRPSSPHACFTQPALFCGLPQVPVPYALYFWRASKASKAAACERTCRACLAWFAVPRRAPRDGPLARDVLDRHVMLLRSGLLRRASRPQGTRTGHRQGGKNHRAPTQRAQQPPPWPLPGSTRDGPSACDALARFVVFLTCVCATP